MDGKVSVFQQGCLDVYEHSFPGVGGWTEGGRGTAAERERKRQRGGGRQIDRVTDRQIDRQSGPNTVSSRIDHVGLISLVYWMCV